MTARKLGKTGNIQNKTISNTKLTLNASTKVLSFSDTNLRKIYALCVDKYYYR